MGLIANKGKQKSREDTGSNIGAGGGGVVDMATGGTVDMTGAGW